MNRVANTVMLPFSEYEELKRKAARPQLAGRLSETETQVMVRLCGGCKPSEIARQLEISIHTVSTHLTRARRKLRANNVTHAAVLFAQAVL